MLYMELTVLLSSSDGTTAMVNTTTGQILSAVDTPDILNCNEYRTFWVNFRPGHGLHIGTGADVRRSELYLK